MDAGFVRFQGHGPIGFGITICTVSHHQNSLRLVRTFVRMGFGLDLMVEAPEILSPLAAPCWWHAAFRA